MNNDDRIIDQVLDYARNEHISIYDSDEIEKMLILFSINYVKRLVIALEITQRYDKCGQLYYVAKNIIENNNKTSTEQELLMRISRLETIVLAQNAAIRYIIDKFYSGDALDYRIACDSGDLDEIQSLIDELQNNKE